MVKKIIVTLIVMLLFVFPVCAQENDVYTEQFEASGAEELNSRIPEDVREFLWENGIDPSNYSWTDSLSAENVFAHIWNFISSGIKTPFKIGAAMLGIILITASLSAFVKENGAMTAALYASVTAVCAIIIVPIVSCISTGVSALKGATVFMLSFIPVFAGIVAASGAAVTSSVMSGVLLLVTQGVSYISSFIITPLMGGYLSVSITSSVSPLINQSGIAESIKKIAMWILSFVSTVFIGVLGIQTTVSASADTLTMRTAKFILGSSIPVAGTAISEAFSTVTSSIGLLKSSVGIYGVVVLLLIFLPIITELIIWRIVLLINTAASDIFSLPKISSVLKAVDMMLSLLIGIILTVAVVFIISLTIVITAGKG